MRKRKPAKNNWQQSAQRNVSVNSGEQSWSVLSKAASELWMCVDMGVFLCARLTRWFCGTEQRMSVISCHMLLILILLPDLWPMFIRNLMRASVARKKHFCWCNLVTSLDTQLAEMSQIRLYKARSWFTLSSLHWYYVNTHTLNRSTADEYIYKCCMCSINF